MRVGALRRFGAVSVVAIFIFSGIVEQSRAMDAACTIIGTADTDIVGTSGDDVICAATGTYSIDAGDGNDIVRVAAGAIVTALLGAGNDHFDGSLAARVTVDGGPGNDTIIGSPGDDNLSGGVGTTNDEDVIDAGDGNDIVDGEENASITATLGAGNDTFDGGSAEDATVDGGTGDDIITGTSGSDDIDGGSDDDRIDGVDGGDTISGGTGDDELSGTPGDDLLEGDDGKDTILGEAGTDTITGGPGDDLLAGGDGVDSLDGGFGLNICDYTDTEPRTTTCTYDDSAPVVQSFSVSPSTVDVSTSPATLTIAFRITDQLGVSAVTMSCHLANSSGVFSPAAFIINFESPVWNPVLSGRNASLDNWSGSPRDFSATVAVDIRTGMFPGEYACNLSARDFINHWTEDNLATLTVIRTGSGFDDDAPLVVSASVTPDSVEVGVESAPVEIDFHVTDQTGTSVVAISCRMDNPDRTDFAAGFTAEFATPASPLKVHGTSATLIEWSGTPRDFTARVAVIVPYGQFPGEYLCLATTIDEFEQSGSSVVDSLTVTRNGPEFDDVGPELKSIVWTDQVVEVGASEAATRVTLRATDVAGIKSLTLQCQSDKGSDSRTAVWVGLQFVSELATPKLNDGGLESSQLISWSGDAHDITATFEVTIDFGLEPGDYQCSLTGVDFRNNWLPREPAGALTVNRTPPGQPSEPSDLQFTSTSPSKGTLSWSPPSFLGDPALQDYEIQYSLDGSTWTTINDGISSTTNLPLLNLSGGTKYYFHVRGENGGGDGGWSARLEVTTPEPTAPSAPLNIAVDNSTHRGFRVDWDEPTESGGRPITDFTVELSVDNGDTWTGVSHSPSNATSMSIAGLAAGTDYLVRVAAVNVIGASEYSAVLETRTNDPVVPGQPVGLVVDTVTRNSFRLDWEAPADNGGRPITDFLVEVSTGSCLFWKTVPHAASVATSMTVTGLQPGTKYCARVSSVSIIGVGGGTSLNVRTRANVPTAPRSLTVTKREPTTIALTWMKPLSLFGFAVNNYLVEFSSNDGATWKTVPHRASTALSIKVSGLQKGRTYRFRVSAVTSVGTGDASAELTATTGTTKPGAVTGLAVQTGFPTRTTVRLNWRAPVDNGGSPITDYVIEYSRNGGQTWIVVRHAPSVARTITIEGLTPKTRYQVRVRAKTSVGNSVSAAVVKFTTGS